MAAHDPPTRIPRPHGSARKHLSSDTLKDPRYAYASLKVAFLHAKVTAGRVDQILLRRNQKLEDALDVAYSWNEEYKQEASRMNQALTKQSDKVAEMEARNARDYERTVSNSKAIAELKKEASRLLEEDEHWKAVAAFKTELLGAEQRNHEITKARLKDTEEFAAANDERHRQFVEERRQVDARYIQQLLRFQAEAAGLTLQKIQDLAEIRTLTEKIEMLEGEVQLLKAGGGGEVESGQAGAVHGGGDGGEDVGVEGCGGKTDATRECE